MESIVYKIAFSLLKKVNVDFLRFLEEKEIDSEKFFTLPTKELINITGIRNDHDFDKLKREEALNLARKEWNQIKPHSIKPLFVLDDDYPRQLAEIPDAPIILYKLGDADLEARHSIAVVGTRKPSTYGFEFCNKLVDEFGDYFKDGCVVSGLAYGIDAAAHKKALEKDLQTVAVVAHGLNMIYPVANRSLAKEIIHNGGAIVSEYTFGVQPFRRNFLARNRIVAGISKATVVVESKIKGGAMSTANFAFQYNRDLMALPGRATDELSAGCNHLIRKNKAHLIESCADLIDVTGWQPLDIPVSPRQRNLFPELEGNAKRVYEILQQNSDPMQVDQIGYATGIATSELLSLLGELEFEGVLMKYPGNRYSIS